MNIDHLTPQQLRQAANLKERIESLQKELKRLIGETVTAAPTLKSPAKRKRKLSAKGRANIRAGVRARMARQNAEKAGKVQPKPKTKPVKKARVKRVDQSDAVIAILKKAGKPLNKQQIVKQIKDFKPNSWFLTMASAKKKGVKQQGDKAQATYSV